MIDGSEKRNRQLAFELQNSHVCEKRSKLFRSLSRDCHTSKNRHESRDLRITTRDYIVCYEHRKCNRFLISCDEAFQCSQSSSMLQR